MLKLEKNVNFDSAAEIKLPFHNFGLYEST